MIFAACQQQATSGPPMTLVGVAVIIVALILIASTEGKG
jgi:hypothetical protein